MCFTSSTLQLQSHDSLLTFSEEDKRFWGSLPKERGNRPRKPWTEAEESRLRHHAKAGPVSRDVLAFWIAAEPLFPGRTGSALLHRARKLHVWTVFKSRNGAEECVCPCGNPFAKTARNRGDDPVLRTLCPSCVRRRAVVRRKDNHRFVCVRCHNPSLGGRRRHVCDGCRDLFPNQRLHRAKTPQI